MNEMNITSAQYVSINDSNVSISIIVDGQFLSVPIIEGNRHYAEIMRQVEAGTLTIAEASA